MVNLLKRRYCFIINSLKNKQFNKEFLKLNTYYFQLRCPIQIKLVFSKKESQRDTLPLINLICEYFFQSKISKRNKIISLSIIIVYSQMEQYQSDHLEFTPKSHFTIDGQIETNLSSFICKTNRQQSTAQSDFSLQPLKFIQYQHTLVQKVEQKSVHPKKQILQKSGCSKFTTPLSKSRWPFYKQNNTMKMELNKKIKDSQRKKKLNMHKKSSGMTSLINLQERSLNLDEELKKLKDSRQSSKNIKIYFNQPIQQNNSVILHSQLKTNVQKSKIYQESNNRKTTRNQKETDNNFLNLTSKLTSIKNLQISKGKHERKKSKCFYDKLKQRLSVEMEKINQKLNQQSSNQKLFNCEMKKNTLQDPNNRFITSVTDRPRHTTALTRSGLQIKRQTTPFKRKRPMSTQAKILQKKQISYFHEKVDLSKNGRSKKSKNKAKSTGKMIERPTANRFHEKLFTKTLRHINPLYKQQNWSANQKVIDHQKLKQKMLTILIDCHSQQNDSANIQRGIKIFQNYSERIGNRLQKTNKLINNVQKTQTIDVQYEYDYA